MIFDKTYQKLLREQQTDPSTRTVIIVRGTSGAGKSAFSQLISEPKVVCTADDYFEKDGEYKFDVTQLGDAHNGCQRKFDEALNNQNVKNIVVANTNIKPKDFQYYEKKAQEAGVRVVYVILEKRHDNPNVHNVPDDVLTQQHSDLMSNIKLS
jgi:uridine kinase